MCGICGIINTSGKPVDKLQIDLMVKTLDHRGPDDRGTFLDGVVGLGHTRLSIIDLSELGHQPMQYEDIVITYNGEIYNYREIRKSLESAGHRFISNSDTEVIIRAYLMWGIDAVKRFNGMFAFCLFDKRKGKVFLVRDRFGVKPLYYLQNQDGVVFGSTIHAIQKASSISRISKNAIRDYINFLYIPGDQSIYEDVKRLLPGHYFELDISSGVTSISGYYHVKVDEQVGPLKDSLRNIEDLLMSSVQFRMISDVPVGIFLSGGVDSGLVCAMAAAQTERRLNTYSIGYGKEGRYFDETKYALRVSNRYKTNHTRFEVNLEEVFSDFDAIVSNLDEPNADTSVFLNFYIARQAREHVTVALSGVGGDELFGGYNRYQAYLIGQKLSLLPEGLRLAIARMLKAFGGGRSGAISNAFRAITKLLDSIHDDPARFYQALISYSDESSIKSEMYRGEHNLNTWMKFDIEHYLPDDVLSLTDQMSMAHSLEVREPFLDFRLVDQAFQIRPSEKVSLFEKKIILKKLAEKYLDKETIYRRKQGFSAPIGPWLKKTRPEEYVRQFSEGPLHDFISEGYTAKILDGFYKENKDLSLQLYSLVVLNRWLSLNLN